MSSGHPRAMYLADHSAVSRIQRNESVRAAFDLINASVGVLCSCAVTVDEAAYSARDGADLDRILRIYTEVFHYLPMDPAIDGIVRAIRQRLWAAGHGRSAQATDLLIAATAVHYNATVLHYDKHFDLIGAAYPEFAHRWVVPRGSVS
ncbi:PIN domain-containing protein [Nocardia cyriacigeorgica]|uniref:PIN domain-containing protein n=2 Tax=Nocardia cyriacigeorgica TaxID=135487 RepID=UPI0018959B75|nr:PIN domain-containing protein [Nocardia cyriacigeorgica]MBF6097798.1 PIN domain-containing protein [Nocardia cyriacigeorgica]MBF6161559.1 PIN domain-containing protein [Nocardia cyriacigeorgica]MBF6200357.1 PIN domain-containing protein [Nocardia cyriacigeorgica]MBF6316277.1 PIN domain-containing protein [Nocardia cyriacigeorgica]MBF6342177.1 PIN domain-containing protein [Nocardia cyriacigeorgica]